jgi:hypothetical protein
MTSDHPGLGPRAADELRRALEPRSGRVSTIRATARTARIRAVLDENVRLCAHCTCCS